VKLSLNLTAEAVAAMCVTVLELHGMNLKMLYMQRQKIRIHKKNSIQNGDLPPGICEGLIKLMERFCTVLFQNLQKNSFF
jgi:hypothetical protein